MGLCALQATASWAQTPQDPLIQVEDDGAVVTTVLIEAPQEEVRQLLNDPASFSSLTPDVLSLSTVPRGDCQELRARTRGFLRPLNYRTVRCPRLNGWHESLLTSDDFTRYDAELQLEPVAGGTHVIYRLAIAIDLPVPKKLISENVKRSARITLGALRARFSRKSRHETEEQPATD